MPLTVFTQRNFVADFLLATSDFSTEIDRFAFLKGVTYDDHLRLIGKDFLLALIELFSLGVTAEALRAIIGSKSATLLKWGPVDPKFQVEGVAPTNRSSAQKTRLKCCFAWYINLDRSFYCFVTIHACDGQTDGQTDRLITKVFLM